MRFDRAPRVNGNEGRAVADQPLAYRCEGQPGEEQKAPKDLLPRYSCPGRFNLPDGPSQT